MPTQVRLPDELWIEILSKLSYRDLGAVSNTCKRLDRLSCEESLWSRLLPPDSAAPPPPDDLMKSKFKYKLLTKIRRRLTQEWPLWG